MALRDLTDRWYSPLPGCSTRVYSDIRASLGTIQRRELRDRYTSIPDTNSTSPWHSRSPASILSPHCDLYLISIFLLLLGVINPLVLDCKLKLSSSSEAFHALHSGSEEESTVPSLSEKEHLFH